MMLDLEEQDQLDRMRAWWHLHGRKVVMVLVLSALIIGGITGWRYYQKQQLAQAGQLDLAFQEAYAKDDRKQMQAIGGQLITDYARTPYALRAALALAQVNYDNGDLKSAKAQLQWVSEHARDSGLKDIANLRQAAILLEEKNFEAAKGLVSAPESSAYNGLYGDLRGDIALAQGKAEQAREAWTAALKALDEKSNYRQIIQMKLDALG